MPISEARKLESRARIVDAAARLFRARGYHGATIDQIMAAAELTHGAFYAHFGSKQDLFREVVRSRHDLLHRLQGRRGDLDAGCRRILRAYVDPRNQGAVGPHCTLSNLGADVARTDASTREELEEVVNVLAAEIGRGSRRTRAQSLATLCLVVGGVMLANGCQRPTMRRDVLRSCRRALDRMLEA